MRLVRILALPIACALAGPPVEPGSIAEAEGHLFAARYREAAHGYRKLLAQDPSVAAAYDGLVRALLGDKQADKAYAAAEEGARLAPGTAAVLTAQGRVAFRRGKIAEADALYRKAFAADAKYAGAIAGLADLFGSTSNFKRAKTLANAALALSPNDPDLLLSPWRSPPQEIHERDLRAALAILDKETERGRHAQTHLARDLALKGRKRKLLNPVDSTEIKLRRVMDGPNRVIGLGVQVQLNNKHSWQLLLDTGASGVAISPQAAKRAGLEQLTEEGADVRGIGDKPPERDVFYLADRLRIGELEWQDFPVSAFRGATVSGSDGLIGSDVFERFRVEIDFAGSAIRLDRTLPEDMTKERAEAVKKPDGFTQVIRLHHMLFIPTSLNDREPELFGIDSGSMVTIVNVRAAQGSTKVHQDARVRLKGVQGEVKDVRSAEKGTLTFAGFRRENREMTAIDLQDLSDRVGVEISGIIGMPVLWQMRMTIDYASGSVKFERSPHFTQHP
jgi:tetratricopeptide (TPR) repeat protein